VIIEISSTLRKEKTNHPSSDRTVHENAIFLNYSLLFFQVYLRPQNEDLQWRKVCLM
jgi:hypothetical protein